MSETPKELKSEPSIQQTSQPDRRSPPPPVFQQPLPNQDPSETQQPSHLHSELQLTEFSLTNTSVGHQHQAKLMCIKNRRLLLLLLGFSSCAAILGLIYYMHQKCTLKNISNDYAGAATPCLSQACIRASIRLSMFDDPFTQPCDYFLFTCGSDRFSPDSRGRQRGQGIPGHPQNQNKMAVWPEKRGQRIDGKDRGLTEEKILNRKTVLLQYLREILESIDKSRSSAAQKAKRFYSSCLDTTSIEAAGAEPFLTLIQKVGGWAVSGQWNQTDFNSTLILLMRDYNTFPFFNLYVGKNQNESTNGTTKRYIQIDQPDLLIPIEWNSKTNKSQVKAQTLRPFLLSCQRYLALLGATSSSSMIHEGTFMSLSSELAVASAPLDYRLSQGQLYKRMTIKELQGKAPAIDWLRCLRAVFHPQPLNADDHVLLHNLPYIVHMSSIIGKWLNKYELSSSGPLQTYMVLNLLHTMMPALDSRFSETAHNLSVALGNTEEVVYRWKYCLLETERGFYSVLTHLLSERTTHKEAEEIIQNVFSSFKSKLHELKWIDEKALQSIMKKTQSLIPRLFTTKVISSEAQLDLFFSKVSFSNSFFSNYIQLLSLWQKRRSQFLTYQTEETDILSVTPYIQDNELIFPMGMFTLPLFHPTYPRAMNYGVMGFLIAKDILHLLLPDIYNQSETVHTVGECVWTHYLTVTEKERRGEGFFLSKAQQQEVWVQYSALQIALQAYHQSFTNHPTDTSILGFSYTRLFFSSFSQINCDSDPYHQFMPLEPSFLITVMCVKSNLCPRSLQCPNKTQQNFLQKC
ncbi:kell blood group glycoprotein [Anabas testudineus]|uniref:Kell metallo-endopeptidase (Kell blood group) n=1 Tax=Anabas testudineus TaxID=64144 RepID=A0A3Q1J8Z2_ANATE|nr:kell blood group glycoprotein [Anabas testudineus]